jgi:hypothetical protein
MSSVNGSGGPDSHVETAFRMFPDQNNNSSSSSTPPIEMDDMGGGVVPPFNASRNAGPGPVPQQVFSGAMDDLNPPEGQEPPKPIQNNHQVKDRSKDLEEFKTKVLGGSKQKIDDVEEFRKKHDDYTSFVAERMKLGEGKKWVVLLMAIALICVIAAVVCLCPFVAAPIAAIVFGVLAASAATFAGGLNAATQIGEDAQKDATKNKKRLDELAKEYPDMLQWAREYDRINKGDDTPHRDYSQFDDSVKNKAKEVEANENKQKGILREDIDDLDKKTAP